MRATVTGRADPHTELPEIDNPAAARALDPDEFYKVLTSRNTGIVSEADQQSVVQARILIAGCGSIGGAAVEPLIRFGFQRLVLADPGMYELNNLNRQNATVGDLGRNKAAVAAERARAINPHADIQIIEEGVQEGTVDELLHDVALIIDGVDITTRGGLAAKGLLHERARAARLPLFTGWDMSGAQYVRVYDYRRGLRIFDGQVTREQMETLPMWNLLARLVPARRAPRDLIRLVHASGGQEGFAFPQLVHAADQFGALATGLAFRIVTGQPVAHHIAVNIHAVASPWRQRLVESVMQPVAAGRLLASLISHARPR
ncbi:hypothetical protein StoSoilB3_00400 [Arthrobacter sp. StoSoilB3]|nr:hypothetical protein StoSoilB3_00400 [Arthrobacter sp. StoSoilB3]